MLEWFNTAVWGWPQIVTICWLFISTIATAIRDTKRYDVFVNMFGSVVGPAVTVFVLAAGGFFA